MKTRCSSCSKVSVCAALGTALAGGTSFSSGAYASDVLPKPEASFKGTIGRTCEDSQPDKFVVTKAPAGAPNRLHRPGAAWRT